MPRKGGPAMASISYTQVYGATDSESMIATGPGDGEAASDFSIDEYMIPDRTPALAIVAVLVVFVLVRLLWEKGA